MSDLCRRFGISRQTGYKWLRRRQLGDAQMGHVLLAMMQTDECLCEGVKPEAI